MKKCTALALLLLLGAAAPAGSETRVPGSQAEVKLSFAPVVRQTSPAVVNVYASRKVATQALGVMADPFFRQFFGDEFSRAPRQRVHNSLGSGVIVDPQGLIVTNNHVVKGGTDIRIALPDRREFEAKLLIADERTDLAVLKIDTQGESLPALKLSDSDDLEVGDLVLAIGNPFGVGQTVTSGIVSALARTQVGISDYQFFIQTDAAINPGNSGGALVNLAGELVGINTAIFSRSGGSIGIGFAIPANMVRTVVRTAEAGGRVQRPWSGADLQDVTPDIAESLGLARPEGALVRSLHADSPLRKAGLEPGDVILAIDGRPIENAREFSYRVATADIGASAMIEYQTSGVRRESRMELIVAPETTAREETLIEGSSPFAGLVVANLSPAVADELNLASQASGVVAADIKGGPARRIFRKGDVILEVNGIAIDSVETLNAAIVSGAGYWEFALSRGGRVLRLQLGG